MFITLAKSPVISQMPNMPEPASATAIGTPASRQSSRTSIGSAATMEIFSRPHSAHEAEGASWVKSNDWRRRTRGRSTSMSTVSARKPIGTRQ